ncbi:hypothetical protein FJ967_28260 [Mesorhizobium sp. B2-3-4]|nr:hypothetical protein FJ967_28260 [Mesorhizobium sp. B2-3-4]
MTYYVGILDGADNVWGVRIPDLPGCHGGGASPDEAVADAVLAACEWTEIHVAKRLPVPSPRTLADLLGEIDNIAGESAVSIG